MFVRYSFKFSYVRPQTFAAAKEENTAFFEGKMEQSYGSLLYLRQEVNQQIAAANQIQSGERGIL